MAIAEENDGIIKLIRAAGKQRRKNDGANSYRSVEAGRLLALLCLFVS